MSDLSVVLNIEEMIEKYKKQCKPKVIALPMFLW